MESFIASPTAAFIPMTVFVVYLGIVLYIAGSKGKQRNQDNY